PGFRGVHRSLPGGIERPVRGAARRGGTIAGAGHGARHPPEPPAWQALPLARKARERRNEAPLAGTAPVVSSPGNPPGSRRRRGMKAAVLRLMQDCGAFTAVRLANRNKALVLTYHRFSDDGADGDTSVQALVAQLEYLSEHYEVVTLGTLANHLDGSGPLP